MVKVASLFSQLLAHFPRTEFARLVVKRRTERAAEGVACWTQFVAMLFCQVARADSLREICNGLSSCLGKLVHLGVGKAPNKLTLSYANEHRSAEKCPYPLRRVVVWDERNHEEIVLLTNHLEFRATTIAAIFKDRWQIELFFKALKQNLKVKTFVGTSDNALRIQIWTALLALLLLKWLHHLSKARWSLPDLASMLRLNLFTDCDLNDWIHNPFGSPPVVPAGPEQLLLLFADLGQPNA